MEYFRHGPYLDVEFEDDPPLGAKHVKAELLNGVEDMLSFTSSELNGRLSDGELSATYLTQTGAAQEYATAENVANTYVTRESVFVPAPALTPLQGGLPVLIGWSDLYPSWPIAPDDNQEYRALLDVRQIDGWTSADIDVLFTMDGTAGGDIGARAGIFSKAEGANIADVDVAGLGSVNGYPAGAAANAIVRSRLATTAVAPNIINALYVEFKRANPSDTATDNLNFLGVVVSRAA